jgi:hypothetical protein
LTAFDPDRRLTSGSGADCCQNPLVDVNLVLGLPGPLGPEVLPDGDRLRAALIANTWDFGWLGKTTAHRAFSGYSIWLWTSTLFLGLIDVVIGLSLELPRKLFYRLTVLNLLAYVVFTVFSFVSFVYAPLFNGVVATIAFALGTCSLALEQRASG